MIVVNTKETKEPSGLSQLLLGKNSEKGTNETQFAKFLESFNLETETGDKTLLQKVVTLKNESLKESESSDKDSSKSTVLKDMTLMHLLQGEQPDDKALKTTEIQSVTQATADDESQFLHPKMINTLDQKDIKLVVNSAKEYLKGQIDAIVKEQNIDLKNTPKSLKGLSELAHKLGVNLEKITLEHISFTKSSLSPTQEKEPLPLLDMNKQASQAKIGAVKSTFAVHEQIESKKAEPLQSALHLKNEKMNDKSSASAAVSPKNEEEKFQKPTNTPVQRAETKAAPSTFVKVDERKNEEDNNKKVVSSPVQKAETKAAPSTFVKIDERKNENVNLQKEFKTPVQKNDDDNLQKLASSSSQKADSKTVSSDLAHLHVRKTEEEKPQKIINTTVLKGETKASETVSAGIHVKRDDISKEKNTLKTAAPSQRVDTKIAELDGLTPAQGSLSARTPKVTVNDPLSELLFGERKSDNSEAATLMKAASSESKLAPSSFVNLTTGDSLEVKVKEAQQMVRHFATEVKEAVENYKPPFTRLKMTLNPAKLGEVDVTLIQRGNNVQINVSSNSTALNILAQNVNDLKVQLANNGVVNTSMQFSTSHGEHQHKEGHQQQFAETYKNADQLSEEELEMITSMEITLPKYV